MTHNTTFASIFHTLEYNIRTNFHEILLIYCFILAMYEIFHKIENIQRNTTNMDISRYNNKF